MNRTLGLSAGAIALLALVLHIAIPGKPEDGGAGSNAAAAGSRDQAASRGTDGSKEGAAAEGPWLATRPFFRDTSSPSLPCQGATEKAGACATRGKGIDFESAADIVACAAGGPATDCANSLSAYFGIPISDRPNIKFLLATVPDPLHTRLSLFTDASVEAIQKAAAQAHWLFATQWLPWNDSADPDEKDPRKRAEDREFIRHREQQPGILVFRRMHLNQTATLIVFLAGETPTAGVNPTQFQIARAYMRAIGEPIHVRIQGPTFSGSLDSLDKLLMEDGGARSTYMVRGGTPTDRVAIKAFQQHWDFKSARDFAARGGSAGLREVLDHLGIAPRDAAILAEDETGYGEAVGKDEKNTREKSIRVIHFPRDISHLRNAYREDAQGSRPNGAPAPDVDFSLKDSDASEDSIPTFSKAQTPLEQSALLNEITDAFRRDGTRMVEIDATNVLDLLFLARVLKRHCPDTRLLLPYPDLLFVEEAQSQALTGTLALSRYPLFLASNDWMGKHDGPVIFTDDNSAGVDHATLALLKDLVPDPDLPNNVRKDLSDAPPDWLLMLDRDGYVPIQVWGQPANRELPPPRSAWVLASTLTALAACLLLWWTLYLSRHENVRAHAAFALDVAAEPQDRRRLPFLFMLAAVLAALQYVISAPYWIGRFGWHFIPTKAIPLAGIGAAVWCAWLAARQSLRAYRQTGRKKMAPWVFALAALPAIPILWLLCCAREDAGFFFSFRAAELRIGTSPVWPVASTLGILLLFSWVHVRRLYLSSYQKPEILVTDIRTALGPRIQDFHDRFNEATDSPLGLHGTQYKWAARAVLFALVLASLGHLPAHLSSVDGWIYNSLSISLLTIATAALLLACWHVRGLWRDLEGLLACFRTLPLARAFVQPDHSSGKRPIWVRRLNLQCMDVHAKALMVLHDLKRRDDASWGKLYDDYLKAFQEQMAVDKLKTRLEALEGKTRLREKSTAAARKAFDTAVALWRSGPLAEQRKPQAGAGEEQNFQGLAPLEIYGDPGEPGPLAEAFLALHYSSFLLYGVRQVQNLLMFLSGGFVLLVISMDTYALQAPQFIGRLLLGLFVVAGAVTWTCVTGMERDPILSRIAGTTPGKLTPESYLKVVGYGALPVIGFLASQFPAISSFLYSWIAPTLQSIH